MIEHWQALAAFLSRLFGGTRPTYIAGEFDYGIVYMRDDAAEILLKYIEELESGEDDKL